MLLATKWAARTKWEIERYVRGLGLPATIIRPVAFMENYLSDQMATSLRAGGFPDPIRPDKPYQTIASRIGCARRTGTASRLHPGADTKRTRAAVSRSAGGAPACEAPNP